MAVSNDLPPTPIGADPGGYAWSDWYQKLRTMLNSSVRSFNNRTGAITLTSGDVTTALTYTPYNATNPAGYITAAGAPVQTFNTRTGAITLLSADVTSALGFTPATDTAVVHLAGTESITGTKTFTQTVTGPKFQTATAAVSVPTATATTVYTIPNAAVSMYLVSANIGNVGDAVNYSAFAVIAADGASARICMQNNGALMTITLVGLAVKVTQSSGGTFTANVTVTKIG